MLKVLLVRKVVAVLPLAEAMMVVLMTQVKVVLAGDLVAVFVVMAVALVAAAAVEWSQLVWGCGLEVAVVAGKL